MKRSNLDYFRALVAGAAPGLGSVGEAPLPYAHHAKELFGTGPCARASGALHAASPYSEGHAHTATGQPCSAIQYRSAACAPSCGACSPAQAAQVRQVHVRGA